LARLVKGSPALLALFESSEPGEILHSLDTTEGGPAFRCRLEALLDDFGLQSGASQGVMRRQVMPGWREDPSLVIAIVQRYLPQDLEALVQVRSRSAEQFAAQVQRLKTQVAEAGATPEQYDQFDFWFEAFMRQVTSAVDHNYYLDAPMNALLHRALMACGRRLAAAGAIEAAVDVWWLRASLVAAAVRSLDAPNPPEWRRLVAAHKALHTWQRSLTPPGYLGAPPPSQPSPPSVGTQEKDLPANLLVKGRGAAPGIATGRVRLADWHAMVPEVQPGDVFVAHDCGVLWATVLPVVAAVVLDSSNPGEHPMRICYEFGIPGVVRAGNATQVLHEGQLVTVDGGKGWVLASENEP
jgi:pyruvate,water dikinase